jgi:hypothetical protein
MSLRFLGRAADDAVKGSARVAYRSAKSYRKSKSYVGVTGKRVFPPTFEIAQGLPRAATPSPSRPKPKGRVKAPVKTAGLPNLLSTRRPIGIRGIDVDAAFKQEPGIFSKDPAERALAIRNVYNRVSEQANRGEDGGGGGGVAGFVGRTATNLARQSWEAAVGLPGAVKDLTGLAADAAITAAPARIPASVRRRSGERVTDYVGQMAKQPVNFTVDFAKDPLGTIQNRPLEVLTYVPAGWNIFGRGAAAAGRATGAAGRVGADIANAPNVRVGIARTRARAREAQQERRRTVLTTDQQAAARRISMMANPYAAPRPREFKFDGRQAQVERERRAAEVTGNRVGGRVFDITQKIGDWASDSYMPGSRRFREPEKVDAPMGMADRDKVGPVEIRRRMRSSNPLSREIQILTDRYVRPRTRGALEVARGALPFVSSSYESAVRREVRNRGYSVRETTDVGVMAIAGDFAKIVNRLKGSGRRGNMPESEVAQASAAAAIRLMGLNDLGFGSRTAGRDTLLKRMRERADELDLEKPPVKSARDRRQWGRERQGIQQNIETLESIPDEWLDPDTAPKIINDLVAEEKKISRAATNEKIAMGLVSPSAADWSDIRAQAQLLGARPASRIREEVSGGSTRYPGYRSDLQEARALRDEIERRTMGTADPRSRYAKYTTEALRTMERARARRGATIRRRVRPFIRDAEENALRPYEGYQRAQREVQRLSDELRALSARRDGSAFNAPLEAAIRDREEGIRKAIFERDRAAERARMARQGRRAMDSSGKRRQQRAARARAEEERRALASAKFDRDRGRSRARMARQGQRALEAARLARLRRERSAAAARAAGLAPSVRVALGQAFNAGQRKGSAKTRAAGGKRRSDGQPGSQQSSAFGTMFRSDAQLYVARQRQRRAAEARGEVDAASRAVDRAAAARGRGRSKAEEQALRDAAEARDRINAIRAARQERRQARRSGRPRTQRSAAEDLALRQYAEARGNLRGTPREAAEAERRRQRLVGRQSQDRLRPVGSSAQIRAATRSQAEAQARARAERERALRTAYTGYDLPERAGMDPGSYYPIRPNVNDRAARRSVSAESGNATSGARLAPAGELFNAGVQMERGDIDFSPQQIIAMLRQAIDARERSQAAADILSRYAMRDANGRLITGDAAEQLKKANRGFVETITMRELARISSLSADSEAGRSLQKALDDAIFASGDTKVAIPTAVREGWADALGRSNVIVRSVEYLNSLWKGGVLALNPRWYVQNFFGMWGQFLLGAGADLHAISMARNAKYLESIPGRIAANGLAADLGEYAARMQGRGGNWYQSLVRGGFNLNSILEAAPRRAMFWSAAKRNLQRNQFMENGVMNEAYLARAWADVMEGVKRNDPGAEAILDETILVTERFMGNYSRYNPFEKNFLRLVFPFYGWMRAIHRLAFGLPFKHPKRAALLILASQMAFEEYDLNRNYLTSPRSGVFIGGRMFGTSTWNPAMSVVDTLGLEAETGATIANLSSPLSYAEAPFLIGTDILRSGVQQAGPLLGIPYRAVSGETPAGIPDRFSPGYDRRWQKPTGGFIGTDALTGGESNAPPRRGFFSTVEQSFPVISGLRRAFAGGTPVADANLANLGIWAAQRRNVKDAPYMVVNDPRTPAVVQTDGLSALTNLLLGVPVDRVDWNAALLREDQSLTNLLAALESAESRKEENIAQQKAKRKKARR